MTVICFGSLAFDRLMTFPGVFADSFIADKLDQINLSWLVERVRRAYGGTNRPGIRGGPSRNDGDS